MREANRVTKQATSRGTDMHTLAEHHLCNKPLPRVQPLSQYLFAQAKPTLDKVDNIHAIEQSLFSYELGVAGSVDCIAEYEGELAVIDFKTAKKPKPREWVDSHFVQCAAYACMLYEMTGIMVKKFVIIMSCENGEVEVYEEYDKRKFINLLSKYIREFVEYKLHDYAQSTEDSISKLIENKFYSSKKFAEEIEKITYDNKDMSYIDAIVFLSVSKIMWTLNQFPS